MTYLSLILATLFLCNSSYIPESTLKINDDFYLEFQKIDNRVEVFVGDSLIYNSGIVRKNPNLQIQVFIDDSLLKYSKELTVKLINGTDTSKDGDDIHWEIRYYLFKGEEVIDYMWEDADDGRAGVVFEETYILE